jgi:hypothetical protein
VGEQQFIEDGFSGYFASADRENAIATEKGDNSWGLMRVWQ